MYECYKKSFLRLLTFFIILINPYLGKSQGLKEFYVEDMKLIFLPSNESFLYVSKPNEYFTFDYTQQYIKHVVDSDTQKIYLENFIFKHTDIFKYDTNLWVKNIYFLKKVHHGTVLNSYYFNTLIEKMYKSYVLTYKEENLKLLIKNYILNMRNKRSLFYLFDLNQIKNIQLKYKKGKSVEQGYQIIKNKYKVGKFKIPLTRNIKKELNLFEGVYFDFSPTFIYATTSFSNQIYIINLKDFKLKFVHNKGYFYSDSLLKYADRTEKFMVFTSKYYDIFVDTVNQNLYRTYYVGIQDTITIDDDITHKHPVYVQVFSLDDVQFKYEIPLKTFKNFTLPKMFYAEHDKLWFYCESEHKFLIFSIKIE